MEGQIELTADGPDGLWGVVSSRLRGALNETTYRTWFGDARGVEVDADEFGTHAGFVAVFALTSLALVRAEQFAHQKFKRAF